MIHSYVFEQGRLVGSNIDLDALRLVRGDPGLHVWVDLDCPTDAEVKQVLEGVFSFHPLAIEDCIMVSQLPKIEDYEDYLFMVIHAVSFKRKDQFQTTELDLFLGKEFIVTYHTEPLKGLATVRDKLVQSSANIARGPDRLTHAILDILVDNYKPVLDELADELQEIEDALFATISYENMDKMVLHTRKEINYLRSVIRPQHEVLSRMARGEFKIIRSHLLPYYRDITDHLLRFDSLASNYADQLLLTMDIYLNKAQNETNQIIKALTLMTALTIPVTVIGGWYGMNFKFMPELEGTWSYLIVVLFTLASTAVIAVWLKRKGWF